MSEPSQLGGTDFMISSIGGFPWCVEILFRSSSPFIIGDCCPLLEAIVEDDVIWIV